MARPLSQILTELNSVYSPQKDLYNQQINTLDPQMQAEEQGLQATQRDSFAQIQQGANRRGLNFSGIPLQEQAQYTGQSFLPAVANLKAKYAQQRFNLQDAISKITQDQYSRGQDIYQTELNRDQAGADAAASRAASGGMASPSFGGGQAQGQVQGASAQTNPVQQQAYNDVYTRLSKQNDAQIRSDYAATLRSARFGNEKDKYKILLYSKLRPDLFRTIPGDVLVQNKPRF